MLPVWRCQIKAHEIHRGKVLDVRLSLAVALSTMNVIARFGLVTAQFFGEHYKGNQAPPTSQVPLTSLPLPQSSREDLWIDDYLENLMPQGHYAFTNTQAFSGIRIQVLRHSSQRR
ncbi:hypothetical protein TNCV_413081 [Trichonephila clavipes]|nr:hypothetical protein TNCV_413081 [Trichonephila clavipes]